MGKGETKRKEREKMVKPPHYYQICNKNLVRRICTLLKHRNELVMHLRKLEEQSVPRIHLAAINFRKKKKRKAHRNISTQTEVREDFLQTVNTNNTNTHTHVCLSESPFWLKKLNELIELQAISEDDHYYFFGLSYSVLLAHIRSSLSPKAPKYEQHTYQGSFAGKSVPSIVFVKFILEAVVESCRSLEYWSVFRNAGSSTTDLKILIHLLTLWHNPDPITIGLQWVHLAIQTLKSKYSKTRYPHLAMNVSLTDVEKSFPKPGTFNKRHIKEEMYSKSLGFVPLQEILTSLEVFDSRSDPLSELLFSYPVQRHLTFLVGVLLFATKYLQPTQLGTILQSGFNNDWNFADCFPGLILLLFFNCNGVNLNGPMESVKNFLLQSHKTNHTVSNTTIKSPKANFLTQHIYEARQKVFHQIESNLNLLYEKDWNTVPINNFNIEMENDKWNDSLLQRTMSPHVPHSTLLNFIQQGFVHEKKVMIADHFGGAVQHTFSGMANISQQAELY